jgi:Transglycosylase SLT domain
MMLFGALAWVQGVSAARIEIPLRVPFESLREALNAELSATPYRDGPCRYLKLAPSSLTSAGAGRVRLAGPGSGALGVAHAGACRTAAAWRGSMQVTLEPHIDAAGRVRMRVVDSGLTDARGGAAPLVWDTAKRHVHPRLERFGYDLADAREALAAIVRSAAPATHAEDVEQALRSLQFLQPRVESSYVVVPASLEVPDAWLAVPPPPAGGAPLTEAEIEALEKALEPWDAFLLYVVRHLARDGGGELRNRLFTLLLDSRYHFVAILSGQAATQGDPVRALFLEAWTELRDILSSRYPLFLDAGDALAALEVAAPGLPLSIDGLRRLARTLAPADNADPLAYDWAQDAELGALFSVEALPEAAPSPPPPQKSWLDFLVRRAYAETPLDRWIPARKELAMYEQRVGRLLRQTSESELGRTRLASPHEETYRHLVPTTALIESCWRQYVMVGGKVSFLRSPAGSVGIMQINQRVWRGFYDVERLRWDTAYNARAGAQILMRYFKDYAIPYAERSGQPHDVPRAAYAVYNAGPRAVGRFAKSPPHPREARVDEKLWALYQGIAAGGQVDLASCGVKQLDAVSR